jgi:chaperonin GroES
LIQQPKPKQEKQNMAINVKPLGDRILVEPVEEKETKKGGIIIPETAKEKPQEGIVIALGTGKTDDNGKKVPFEVKKGDRVLVSKYGGTEIKIDGKEYKILSSDDLLAVLA